VASEVFGILTGRAISPQSLQGKAPPPPPKIEGKASFLAAVHNSHFFQSQDVVHYWCARSLASWPECAELMKLYIDAETRRDPLLACQSTLDLLRIDELGMARHLVWGRQRRLDLVLGDAIVQALTEIGHDFGDNLSKLRINEHTPRSGVKELTDFYYSA